MSSDEADEGCELNECFEHGDDLYRNVDVQQLPRCRRLSAMAMLFIPSIEEYGPVACIHWALI